MEELTSQPVDIVLCILKNKKGEVLIFERTHTQMAKDGMKLTWVFPGGEINKGETQEEAVIRETKQKTGYSVKVIKLISQRIYPQPYVHLYYYECELATLKVVPIHDIHEVHKTKWVLPKDLMNYFGTDIDPGVAKFLGLRG